MLSSWIIYILLGKLFIYLGQKFPLPQILEKSKTIKQWHECDLCMGVWVYGLLAFFLKVDILSVLGFIYIPFVSELLTGGAVSFVVHIFSIGWRDKFAPDIVL
jgi:hypothetical protein